MNSLVFIRRVIYNLKRRYGFPLDIYRIISTVTNRETGKKIQEKSKYHIKRAIVLPNQVQKRFAFDLAYLAANKDFTYGAEYLSNLRDIIIDVRDLPKEFEITINDYIIYDGKRYQIKIIEIAEHNQAYLIRMDHAPGSLPFEQHDVNVHNVLDLEQGVTNEL